MKYAVRTLEALSVGAIGVGLWFTTPWLLLVVAGALGLWLADGLEEK